MVIDSPSVSSIVSSDSPSVSPDFSSVSPDFSIVSPDPPTVSLDSHCVSPIECDKKILGGWHTVESNGELYIVSPQGEQFEVKTHSEIPNGCMLERVEYMVHRGLMVEWRSRTHIIYQNGTISWKRRPCITLQEGKHFHELNGPIPTGYGYIHSHPHDKCVKGCPFYNSKKTLHRDCIGKYCTVQIANDAHFCIVSTDCKGVLTPGEALDLMIKIAMEDFDVAVKYLTDATQIEFHRLIMNQKIEQAFEIYNYMT